MTSALCHSAILTAILVTLVGYVAGHAEMKMPRPRREGTFSCGIRNLTEGDNVGKGQVTVPGTNCWPCGGDRADPQPDDEYIGLLTRSGPTALYREGEEAAVVVVLGSPHLFFMEFRLSPNASWERIRNQNAYSYLLKVELLTPNPNVPNPPISQDPRFPTRVNVNIGDGTTWLTAKVKLPAGVVCENCVLQFVYRARATETFRSCSDIRIIPAVTNPPYDQLVNKESGQCLSVGMTGTVSALTLATCDSRDPRQSVLRFQSWKDYDTKSNSIALTETNICLDSTANKTATGWMASSSACKVGSDFLKNQRWSFKQGKGGFQVVAENSGLCLSYDKTGVKLVTQQCLDETSAPYQFWSVNDNQVTPDKLPVAINPSQNLTGVGYCPNRGAGTPEGCWDIPPPKLDTTPPFTRLRNVESGRCLSQFGDQALILAKCDSSDPKQRLTLFQPWDEYQGWNHGFAINSVTTCLDYFVPWDQKGVGRPVYLRDCLVSVNEYKESQYWGTKLVAEDNSLQIFSQNRKVCLAANPRTGLITLNNCFDNLSVATDYQYWTVDSTVTTPKPPTPPVKTKAPYIRLMNVETGRCLSQLTDKSLILAPCDSTDKLQSVTLPQTWAEYKDWNNVFALNSPDTCLGFDVADGATGIGKAVILKNCSSGNDYLATQQWGAKMEEGSQNFQIFSQARPICLAAKRLSRAVYLNNCFPNEAITDSYQYWTVVDTPTVPPPPSPKFYLKNKQSDNKCLTQLSDQTLNNSACTAGDPYQIVMLFQPLSVYDGSLTNGIALTSSTTCLGFNTGNDLDPIRVKDCKLTASDYDAKQYWSVKMAENGAYQIVSQSSGKCLTASRSNGKIWLYSCFTSVAAAIYDQYWTFEAYQP